MEVRNICSSPEARASEIVTGHGALFEEQLKLLLASFTFVSRKS